MYLKSRMSLQFLVEILEDYLCFPRRMSVCLFRISIHSQHEPVSRPGNDILPPPPPPFLFFGPPINPIDLTDGQTTTLRIPKKTLNPGNACIAKKRKEDVGNKNRARDFLSKRIEAKLFLFEQANRLKPFFVPPPKKKNHHRTSFFS